MSKAVLMRGKKWRSIFIFCGAIVLFPFLVWSQEVTPQPQGDTEDRLRQLRERVVEIKGKAFDAKGRLEVLSEQLLYDLVADARLVVVHRNDASSFFVLDEALYFLDDRQVFYQTNRNRALESQKKIPVFEGSVTPGSHVLTVELVYRGNGRIFTYLAGYKFRLKANFDFYVSKGYRTEVTVVGFEKGGLTAPLEERPALRFEVTKTQVVRRAAEAEPTK